MKKIELLAPAGSAESLIAAVQQGADAIYVGGSAFSARAFADNFNDEKMMWAIDYCHLYEVKIYVTMNTLIKESEIENALKYASKLYNFGVDALIVQDTGLAFLLKQYLPKFELHASTQMTVHNGEAAEFFRNNGFKRIVLSRELSLREIDSISKDYGVETEIFIHGALCICYSGQCLMSSMIGGRSGNRGRCAQPCRMEYNLINQSTNENKKAYILSPKDINLLENLNEIVSSGTTSLKIEGRMKKPEYVSGVVKIYREALEAVYSGSKFDVAEGNKTLLKLFNREGFSKAYMFGNTGKNMMAYSFPKNTGIILGNVQKGKEVLLSETVSKGDGIRIGKSDEGFIITKISKNGKEIIEGKNGELVSFKPNNFTEGDILYKTFDTNMNDKLKKSYEKPFNKKINIPLKVSFIPKDNIQIKFIFNNIEYEILGDVIEESFNKPTTIEKLQESLGKSGEIPFRFLPVEIENYEEGFMPVSAINQLRRSAMEKLEKAILQRRTKVCIDLTYEKNKSVSTIDNIVYVSTKEQHMASKELDIKNICVDILSKEIPINDVYVKVPNIIREEFEKIADLIDSNINNIKGIITANAGIINRYKNSINIIGDYKLNMFNSYALDIFGEALNGSCVSLELNKGEILEIASKKRNNMQMLIYGKPELMVTEYCPVAGVFSAGCSEKKCGKECLKGKYVLKDRKGEEFSLVQDSYCRTHIYNGVPINLIPNIKEIIKMGINSFRLDFIDESYEETKKILTAFKEKNWIEEYANYTRGHFRRGVD